MGQARQQAVPKQDWRYGRIVSCFTVQHGAALIFSWQVEPPLSNRLRLSARTRCTTRRTVSEERQGQPRRRSANGPLHAASMVGDFLEPVDISATQLYVKDHIELMIQVSFPQPLITCNTERSPKYWEISSSSTDILNVSGHMIGADT